MQLIYKTYKRYMSQFAFEEMVNFFLKKNENILQVVFHFFFFFFLAAFFSDLIMFLRCFTASYAYQISDILKSPTKGSI